MKRIFLTLTLVLFVIPFGISQDLPSYVPTDGLIAYYPFNGNANDASGNGNHGTVNGATLSSDLSGVNSAYSFISSQANISVSNNNILNLSDTDFTISVWAKLDATPLSESNEDFNQYYTILGKRQYAKMISNYSVGISTPNSNIGGLRFTFAQGPRGVGSFIYSDQPIQATENWNNMVLVYTLDDNTIKFLVNGNLLYQEVGVVVNSENVNDADLWFGSDVSGYADDFPGKIDDIGFWNRALTELEIQNLFTSYNGSTTEDILLNGTVSAENHQIKNVADPTDAQDVITKSYFDSNTPIAPNKNIEQILSYGNDANGKQLKGLADPTEAQDAVTLGLLLEKISNLQDQIDALQSTSGSGTVTDQDGNSYPYLTYGDQVWTVKNAEMVTYRDGTPIPQVTDATEWANLTTGAWCYYDNDPNKGKLYNWYAVAGIHDNDENTPNKEFAPEGWHVPTDAEWTELENYLIAYGYNYDGTTTGNKIAKAMSSTTGWNSSTTDGAPGNNQLKNNSSGFSIYPEGSRHNNGYFKDIGVGGYLWTSSDSGDGNSWKHYIGYSSESLGRGSSSIRRKGMSVRFVRD